MPQAARMELEHRLPDSFRVVILTRVHRHSEAHAMDGLEVDLEQGGPGLRRFESRKIHCDHPAGLGIAPLIGGRDRECQVA